MVKSARFPAMAESTKSNPPFTLFGELLGDQHEFGQQLTQWIEVGSYVSSRMDGFSRVVPTQRGSIWQSCTVFQVFQHSSGVGLYKSMTLKIPRDNDFAMTIPDGFAMGSLMSLHIVSIAV